MSILSQILTSTRADVPALRLHRQALEAAAAAHSPSRSLKRAFQGPSLGVIAEIKRCSPSAGAINESLDPQELAANYQAGGAAAISVLTEKTGFGGSLEDLRSVVSQVSLPVIRKDFIVDEIQLVEARACGADAVLLIVRALDQSDLVGMIEACRRWGLDSLVETHDRDELNRAIDAGAEIIGVNARNLDSFEVDVPGSLELLQTIPAEVVAVAESGLAGRADVELAASAGADGVLIGGALAASADPRSAVKALSGVARHGR